MDPHAHHHHHHHHAHGHGHGDGKTLAENNKEHFDGVASTIFNVPWIVELSNQISNELTDTVEWIGFRKDGSQNVADGPKMLDYACGDGLASRTLAPYISKVRGLDISSGMVEQYNQCAEKEGFATEKMHAIHGDLTTDTSSSPEFNSAEYNDFDLVIISMALHHVEDPAAMVRKLADRLANGGVLLVIDWVTAAESGCTQPDMKSGPVSHTVSRMGFAQAEVKEWFETAGVEDWGWRWFSKRSKMPEEFGEQQLFLARGVKKGGQ